MGHRFAWMVAVAMVAVPARAAAPAPLAPVSEKGAFTVLFENDVFFGTDRDYTNGVELTYTMPSDDNPDRVVEIAQRMHLMPKATEVRTSFTFGQSIYTPEHIDLFNPPTTERPYAGFLYGAVGMIANDEAWLHQLQIQLGIIGPAALAQETQKFIHGICHCTKPLGWHTQLRDEPALNITYEASYRIEQNVDRDFGIDLMPHYGGSVGNVYDYVNAGAMMRVGFNLSDDYGPLRIEPGLPGSNFFSASDTFSFYAFAGADGRAIGRNIFLDGNTWQSSRSVVKKNLVGDLEVGFSARYKLFRFSFTHVYRTREFKTQTSADDFGAVSVSFQATF